jgi:hypothetical protein
MRGRYGTRDVGLARRLGTGELTQSSMFCIPDLNP